jgi:3-hydroxyisobutyrate dehydrogenase
MQWADSPSSITDLCDITIVFVSDNHASLSVYEHPQTGIMRSISKGKIVIDMSTISPELSISLAEKVRHNGGDMIDCPVSGSHVMVLQHRASTMVGGRKETYDLLKPLLLGTCFRQL